MATFFGLYALVEAAKPAQSYLEENFAVNRDHAAGNLQTQRRPLMQRLRQRIELGVRDLVSDRAELSAYRALIPHKSPKTKRRQPIATASLNQSNQVLSP